MSVDNSELLMLLGGKKSKSTIGKAGQQGFGVGVYGGSPSDLKAMGLAPMEGCKNPNSENYGNYIHTNGSVMAFIPAFAIRIGNTSAPLYSKYGADTIEIGDVELAGKDGWAILRGFYDGGRLHSGFFIDKYLCSKDPTGKLAVSVKLGEPIPLDRNVTQGSYSMPNCSGERNDAIELSRARGEYYSLVSCYQWAVISLVTQAHAQAATSAKSCAWYDAKGLTNYPKGANDATTSLNKDVDDKSILFSDLTYSDYASRTGSASPIEKTTHNGQRSGICDVNGNMWQPVLGWQSCEQELFKTAKLSVKMHDFTIGNYNDNSLFDDYTVNVELNGALYYWGSPALYATDDTKFPLCGVIPKTPTPSVTGKEGFGKDIFRGISMLSRVLLVAGYWGDRSAAGSWYRNSYYAWGDRDRNTSFRAAAYPP